MNVISTAAKPRIKTPDSQRFTKTNRLGRPDWESLPDIYLELFFGETLALESAVDLCCQNDEDGCNEHG